MSVPVHEKPNEPAAQPVTVGSFVQVVVVVAAGMQQNPVAPPVPAPAVPLLQVSEDVSGMPVVQDQPAPPAAQFTVASGPHVLLPASIPLESLAAIPASLPPELLPLPDPDALPLLAPLPDPEPPDPLLVPLPAPDSAPPLLAPCTPPPSPPPSALPLLAVW